MKRVGCLVFLVEWPLLGWGPNEHRRIAEESLRTLPPTLHAWYQRREADYIQASLEPDLWKDQDPDEVNRHRIYCEAYGGATRLPLEVTAARDRVSPWTFTSSGQLPWVIAERYHRLVQAFQSGDPKDVVAASGWLGHYVADAQVPLHTTRNRNGKLTGQKGVHKRWEIDLLDGNSNEFRTLRPAEAPKDIPKAVSNWVLESHALVESLLKADKAVQDAGSEEAKMAMALWMDQRRVAFQQLQRSAEYTGDLLLAAWIEAGQPLPPGRFP